jgi:hypothetical protein
MIHILGFSYESLKKFNNIYYVESEDSSDNKKRAYAISPKVLMFARKYFNCANIKEFLWKFKKKDK